MFQKGLLFFEWQTFILYLCAPFPENPKQLKISASGLFVEQINHLTVFIN